MHVEAYFVVIYVCAVLCSPADRPSAVVILTRLDAIEQEVKEHVTASLTRRPIVQHLQLPPAVPSPSEAAVREGPAPQMMSAPSSAVSPLSKTMASNVATTLPSPKRSASAHETLSSSSSGIDFTAPPPLVVIDHEPAHDGVSSSLAAALGNRRGSSRMQHHQESSLLSSQSQSDDGGNADRRAEREREAGAATSLGRRAVSDVAMSPSHRWSRAKSNALDLAAVADNETDAHLADGQAAASAADDARS